MSVSTCSGTWKAPSPANLEAPILGDAQGLEALDRLSLYPRLRDHVRQTREKASTKRWLMAEGYQPVGASDAPACRAGYRCRRGFLSPLPVTPWTCSCSRHCEQLESVEITVRNKPNKNIQVFSHPHVLVSKGYTESLLPVSTFPSGTH